ncbi:ABC transporter permease [Oryzihumus leptocrescens]
MQDVLRYGSLVENFARRELRTRFLGSKFGWVWSLVSPMASLAMYTVVFGVILGADRGMEASATGVKVFAVYLFTGLVAWNLFTGVLTRNVDGLLEVATLRRKVAFPVLAPLAGMTVAIVAERSVEVILLICVYVLLGNIGWSFLWIPVLVTLTALFSLGLSMAIASLNVRFRDISHLLGLCLQLLFYATPIIYPAAFVAHHFGNESVIHTLFVSNPLAQFVLAYRSVMWSLNSPPPSQLLGLVVWTIISLTLGWAIFRVRARDVAEEA